MSLETKITTSCGAIAITQKEGQGLPILFIHGNSSCREVFRHQFADEACEQFRLIAMDLPGHGKSDNAKEPERIYTMTGYAQIALEVMQALDIHHYGVIGWSLGGHVGIEMLTMTDEICGLLISGTPPIGKTMEDMTNAFHQTEHMGYTGQEVLSEAEADAYARATCGGQYEPFLGEAVRRTDGRARRFMVEAATRGEGSNQKLVVETNPTPLAIVNGALEPMINNDYVQSLHYANLWQDKVHLLPDSGHAPFWESPTEFNTRVKEFFTPLS